MTPPVRIYMDHNATTPVRPEVAAAMAEALRETWGNPSSIHGVGRRARDAVERARSDVAALIRCSAEEIVFTSGGTEGDNLAIRGLARWARERSPRGPGGSAHLVSSRIEHPAVQGAIESLGAEGFAVTWVPVGPGGEIAPPALRDALREDTVLVTVSAANHEVGTLAPVAELSAAARERGVLFHTDAVQAAGRLPLDLPAAGVDAATISAHKIHGPKGVGAVYLRRGVGFHPLIAGGHQERERRAGTENVPGIVGFGVACRLAAAEMPTSAARVAALRDRLELRVLAITGARLHGNSDMRVPGTTNVGFEGVDGQVAVIALDLEGVCVSTGAACTSGSVEPSPVLLAMGLSPTDAKRAIRFSLGRGNTEEEVDRVADLVAMVVDRARRT